MSLRRMATPSTQIQDYPLETRCYTVVARVQARVAATRPVEPRVPLLLGAMMRLTRKLSILCSFLTITLLFLALAPLGAQTPAAAKPATDDQTPTLKPG